MSKNKKIIKDYENNLEIVVRNFTCEYAGCGSHMMNLLIKIDKEDLITFLGQFDIKKE